MAFDSESDGGSIASAFNLVQGQWFLGTEPLPNQDELDMLRQNLRFLEGVSEERHHKIMDLTDERNALRLEVSQLERAEALLHKVFAALDGENPEVQLKKLRRSYDEYRGVRAAGLDPVEIERQRQASEVRRQLGEPSWQALLGGLIAPDGEEAASDG